MWLQLTGNLGIFLTVAVVGVQAREGVPLWSQGYRGCRWSASLLRGTQLQGDVPDCSNDCSSQASEGIPLQSQRHKQSQGYKGCRWSASCLRSRRLAAGLVVRWHKTFRYFFPSSWYNHWSHRLELCSLKNITQMVSFKWKLLLFVPDLSVQVVFGSLAPVQSERVYILLLVSLVKF